MTKQPIKKQVSRNEIYNSKGTLFSSDKSRKGNKKQSPNKLPSSVYISAILIIVAIFLYAIGSSENAAYDYNNPDYTINFAGGAQITFAWIIGIVAVLIVSSSILNRIIKPKKVKESTAALVFVVIIILAIVFLSIAPH